MKQRKGNLFVVSAPSGAGKTTLCKRICDTISGVRHSVSYTTRKIRSGEINGVHYMFVDEDEFRTMIADGEFVEWAEVYGNFYGTSRSHIEGMINEGIDVVMDIDVQGAKQIRRHFPDSVLIFIMPPSMMELEKRLVDRRGDSADVIDTRLKNAVEEIREYKIYDYVIINNVFEEAVEELKAVIMGERLKITRINHEWIEEKFLKEAQ
ncbi:MAG: guanylate kinase [Thermodesulfovibrionales bacterium]|nr:guanylate kinase [Thermodesulfovibrionales bacterium]